jgi:pimeloyl-ACP methyl ester carboxylesterase
VGLAIVHPGEARGAASRAAVARRIKAPTLVVAAEWDPSQDGQAVFHKLPSGPHKRLVEIGEATHFVMVDKNRMQFFREVQLFLE